MRVGKLCGLLLVMLVPLLGCGGDDDDGDGPGDQPLAGAGAGGASASGAGAGASGSTGASGAAAGSGVGGGAAGGAGMGGAGADRPVPLADGAGVEYRGIVNLVNAEAADLLDDHIESDTRFVGDPSEGELELPTLFFYDHYYDDYDFLFFMTDHDVTSTAAGAHAAANIPPLPGTGQDAPHSGDFRAPPSLRAAIGIEIARFDTFPPFAHEMMHNWANHLDPALGFAEPSQPKYGAHWGVTGVNGQLGGFDPASLRCETPAGQAPPACTAGANGRTRFVVDPFHPAADSYEGIPYGPLELYLMGLIPASEVPSPIPRFEDTTFDVDAPELTADRKLIVEAARIGAISVADIIARHGEVPALPADKRHFRAAFVLLTKAPAEQRYLDALADWAAIFGGELKSDKPSWKSFAELTGNRATLSFRLGPRRTPDGEYQDWPTTFYDLCRPESSAQDCPAGAACYGIGGYYCAKAGDAKAGDRCEVDNDCAPGLICSFVPTAPDDGLCAPYCNRDAAAADACATLCPGNFSPILGANHVELGAFCHGGSGGACDPLAQDCGAGKACSGLELTTCDVVGDKLRGEECFPFGAVCEAGTVCAGIEGMTMYCQPYCDPAPGAAGAKACTTLCPGGAWPYGAYAVCIPD